jgi:hypothetical protein
MHLNFRMGRSMSEESRFTKHNQGRKLLPREVRIIEALAESAFPDDGERGLAKALVEDMNDGAMGSLRFLGVERQDRHAARTIGEAEYVDEDGTVVSIALIVDEAGEPFELDFWKVDFSKLLKYPEPHELRRIH